MTVLKFFDELLKWETAIAIEGVAFPAELLG